jgi:hypothetical protein
MELLDPGIDLHIHQLSRERAVRTVRPGIPPHCHLPPPKRLDTVAKEDAEDVCTQQPMTEEAFEDVKNMRQHMDLLLSNSVPPVGQSGRSPTRNRWEWCIDIILQEEPLPLPPSQQVRH